MEESLRTLRANTPETLFLVSLCLLKDARIIHFVSTRVVQVGFVVGPNVPVLCTHRSRLLRSRTGLQLGGTVGPHLEIGALGAQSRGDPHESRRTVVHDDRAARPGRVGQVEALLLPPRHGTCRVGREATFFSGRRSGEHLQHHVSSSCSTVQRPEASSFIIIDENPLSSELNSIFFSN